MSKANSRGNDGAAVMATFLMHFGLGGVIGMLVMLGIALTHPQLLWGESGQRFHDFLYGPRKKDEEYAGDEPSEPISEDDVAELLRLWQAMRERLGGQDDWLAEFAQAILHVMAVELRQGDQRMVRERGRSLYEWVSLARDEEARRQWMRGVDAEKLKLVKTMSRAVSVALETGREDTAFRMMQELDWLLGEG
ncbi:MAG: hypothetical protein LBE78_01275 [Burkholderiaceae bacterium]|jgi:hypothetical protein|nr:hypothetical protein [Burkholderiaceae bacterium]